MKPNILGIWLPIELERLHAQGWPEPHEMMVDAVTFLGPNGQPYQIRCPDMRRAINDVWAAAALPKSAPERT